MKKLMALLLVLFCLFGTAISESPATPTDLAPKIMLTKPTVIIWDDRKPIMMVGEIITLYSKVENTDGWIIRYQWEQGKDGIFEEILDATEATYSFPATVESIQKDYRLVIYYKVAE